MFSSPRKDDHPYNQAPQEAKHDAEQASKNDASSRTASNSGKAPESERRQDAPGSSSPLQLSPRQDSRGSDSASQDDATSPKGAENAKAKREESKDSGSSLPGIHEHQNHNDEAAAVQRVSLIKAQLEAEQAQKLATEAPPKMVTKASTVPTLMS